MTCDVSSRLLNTRVSYSGLSGNLLQLSHYWWALGMFEPWLGVCTMLKGVFL